MNDERFAPVNDNGPSAEERKFLQDLRVSLANARERQKAVGIKLAAARAQKSKDELSLSREFTTLNAEIARLKVDLRKAEQATDFVYKRAA